MKKALLGCGVLVVGAFVLLVLIGMMLPKEPKSETKAVAPSVVQAKVEEPAPKKEAPEVVVTKEDIEEYDRRHPKDQVSIVKFDWHKGGFDSVMIADFTIKNANTFPVKDLTISCKTRAGSSTVISEPSTTLYEVIHAKESKRFSKVSMGFIDTQSTRAGCTIDSVSVD